MNQATFNLILPNEKKILLPPNITSNQDVYRYTSNYSKDDLILYYKDIPIPKNKKINLIDIGYDPYEKLYMKPVEAKYCTFMISKYNYSTTRKIFSYQTFFEIKIFFAREFDTVAHNIIIKNDSKIFNDEEKLFGNGNIFEIDAIDDFSIYHVFFIKFMFVCLSNDSTFKDLKISLSGHSSIPFDSIKMSPNLNKALEDVPNPDEEKILNYASKFNIFDFICVNMDSINVKHIEILLESDNKNIVYEYKNPYPISPLKKQPNIVIDGIKCFLERKNHVDRQMLIYFDDPQHSGKYAYYSLRKLYVTIDKKSETFPYLMTVKELKEKCSDIDHNLGFVINGRFIFKDSDLLVKYLGSPINDEKNRLHIHIIRPNNVCRLCKIQCVDKFKTQSFIIPSNYTFNEITTMYLGMKPNSMNFFSGYYPNDEASNQLDNTDKLNHFKFTEFHAILKKELVIKYHFANKSKEYTISMNNANNPQIKNFIYEIFKQDKDHFVYDVYFRDRRIDFWEYLIEFSDQTLTIKKYPISGSYNIIYNVSDNTIFEFRSTNNDIEASSIIECFISKNASKYSLYMNFHKLSPEDKPFLLYQPYHFLILNENKEEQVFTVTNKKNIITKEKVGFAQNSLLSTIIINKFGLTNSNVCFSLELNPNSKIELKLFSLPSGFDAGSIPDDSIISIDYKTHKTNNYTFYYEKSPNEVIKETITLSDPTKSIKTLKKEIINKLKIFNISPKVACFYFLDNKLDQNKTFSSYEISENSIITISHNHAIKVNLRLFDDKNLGDYFFNNGIKPEKKDTIKDVIEILKLEYEIDDSYYELKIYSKPDKDSLLDVNKLLENNEVLYASFEKAKIRYFDPIKGERIEVDEILKPRELIYKKYPDIKQKDIAFFKQDNTGQYTFVDFSKTFKEIGCRQLFVLECCRDITFYFKNLQITLVTSQRISKYESVGSIKTNYLSKQILAPPKSFKLIVNNIEVNKNDTIGNLIMNGKKIEIVFIEKDDNSMPQKIKAKSKKKFKPSITSVFDNESSILKHKKESPSREKEEKAESVQLKDDDEEINELSKTKIVKEENLNNYLIDSNDENSYQILGIIYEGSTSIYFKAIDEATGREICKKVIKEASDETAMKVLSNTLKEIDFFSITNHPCICKLLGYNLQEKLPQNIDDDDDGNNEEPKTTIALFFEYLPFSIKQLRDNDMLNNTLKVKISIEIAFGMSYIHSLGMIHRDMKIENIMLNDAHNAKIIGFDLVRLNDDLSKSITLTKGIGTLAYMSPEMIDEKEYDNKTDVYSYGILLYALFIGHLPKQSVSDRLANVELDFKKTSKKINEYGIDLIKRCTSFESSNRPSFDEIIEDIEKHSFSLAPGIDTEVINERYKTLNKIRSKQKED